MLIRLMFLKCANDTTNRKQILMTQVRLPLGDPRLISYMLLGDLPLDWQYIIFFLKSTLCQDLKDTFLS